MTSGQLLSQTMAKQLYR